MTFVKKVLIWGSLALVMYLLLGFHYLYFGGTTVRVLKKNKFTLEDTFTDLSSTIMTNKKILENDTLREAGVADLLVDMGRMSEDQRDLLMEKYEEEEADE